MKTLLTLTLAAAAFAAYAGEDSTHRAGPGGTGPEFYAAQSGLKGFAGSSESRPGNALGEKEMSNEEIRAWMVRHMKVMDETMIRMRDEHRALMGGTGGAAR